MTNPFALVCWEAQFGDFNNTAQVTYIAVIIFAQHHLMCPLTGVMFQLKIIS